MVKFEPVPPLGESRQ